MSDSNAAASAATPAASAAATPAEASKTQSTEANTEGQELSEETAEEGEEGLAASKEEPKKSNKKKLKLKIDGKEEDFEFDPDNQEELVKHLQLSKAAQKRMAESAQLKKDVEAFVNALKGDTKNVLAQLGIDPKKFAEDVINNEIEDMKKSPEQKEREKLQKEIENLRKKDAEREEAQKAAEMQRLQEKFVMEIDSDISTALQSSSLPHSPYVVKRIADTMMLALQNGYENITAKDVIPIVDKQIREELNQLFSSSGEDVLEEIVGKNNLDRLRKSRLKKMKDAVQTATQVKPTGEKTEVAKEQKKMTMREFFKGI